MVESQGIPVQLHLLFAVRLGMKNKRMRVHKANGIVTQK